METCHTSMLYSKNDNSHFSYIGRSYGVDSPVGLVDENLDNGHLSYNYTEPGYLTHVNCFHNENSDFHLKLLEDAKLGNGIPAVYYATGLFANAEPGRDADFFSVIGMVDDKSIAVLAAKRYEGRSVILVAAGSDCPLLNGTQCEVNFAPIVFIVRVDFTSKLISVLPETTEATNSSSFDPTAGLAGNAIDSLNALGQVSTTLYTSVFGNALMSNINAATSDSASFSPATFAALNDSFASMVDGLLLFVGRRQFFLRMRVLATFPRSMSG